jgi:hypothetical protein
MRVHRHDWKMLLPTVRADSEHGTVPSRDMTTVGSRDRGNYHDGVIHKEFCGRPSPRAGLRRLRRGSGPHHGINLKLEMKP